MDQREIHAGLGSDVRGGVRGDSGAVGSAPGRSLPDLLTDAIGLFTVLLLWRKIRSGVRRARQ